MCVNVYSYIHKQNTEKTTNKIPFRYVKLLKVCAMLFPVNKIYVCETMNVEWALWILLAYCFNTLTPRQNGRHFPDDIFKCIFLNENV